MYMYMHMHGVLFQVCVHVIYMHVHVRVYNIITCCERLFAFIQWPGPRWYDIIMGENPLVWCSDADGR